MKRCSRCGETKSRDDFGPDRRRRDGKASYCRPCVREYHAEYRKDPANAARKLEAQRKYREANRETLREKSQAYYSVLENRNRKCDWHFLKRYGLTAEDRAALFEQVGHCCEVCGDTHRLCVDHVHGTNFPRGVLCQDCNQALGRLKDDPALCRALADYVERPPLRLAI